MIDEKTPLGLGSASPRRKALLETLGIPLVVIVANADEQRRAREYPDAYLERVTRDKLEHVVAQEQARAMSVLLVADTIVLLGDEILGKPTDAEDATAMLTRLSGRAHEVRTRFLLGRPSDGATDASGTSSSPPHRAAPASSRAAPASSRAAPASSRAAPASSRAILVHAETVSTVVHFRPLDGTEIQRYVATGEGRDKAGGYAVQGIGSFAVRRIEGSYANVVGLPVCEVVVALRRHGFLAAFP